MRFRSGTPPKKSPQRHLFGAASPPTRTTYPDRNSIVRSNIPCATHAAPGGGGGGAHLGSASWRRARGGDHPGHGDTPVTRGGDAPRDAPREKSGKFRKNRTKPGKITNKKAKIGQKRPKIIKTDIFFFFFGRHPGLRHPRLGPRGRSPRAAPCSAPEARGGGTSGSPRVVPRRGAPEGSAPRAVVLNRGELRSRQGRGRSMQFGALSAA